MDCTDAFDMVIANLDGRIEFLERVVARLKSQGDPCEVSKGEIETLESVKSSVVEYKRICAGKAYPESLRAQEMAESGYISGQVLHYIRGGKHISPDY